MIVKVFEVKYETRNREGFTANVLASSPEDAMKTLEKKGATHFFEVNDMGTNVHLISDAIVQFLAPGISRTIEKVVEPEKKKFPCPHCDYVGNSGAGIAAHVRLKHEGGLDKFTRKGETTSA